MSDGVFIVPDMSIEGRLRVFRRYFAAAGEFDGMEVDAYILTSKRYLVVCDTLLCPEDMAHVMAAIKGELAHRQLLVFNSHADWDHCWGNSYFTGRDAAPIIAHQHALTRLRSPAAQQELHEYQQRYSQFAHVVLTAPTITFTDALTLHGGDLDMQIVHAPGHCADHCALWLPQLRLLLAFDAVEKPFPGIADAQSVPAMFATLERFVSLQARQVLCSHGKTSSPDMLHKNLAYLREIEKRCRELLSRLQTEAIPPERVPEMIHYPFEEAFAKSGAQGDPTDLTYYPHVHEQNVRYVWQWLASKPSAQA